MYGLSEEDRQIQARARGFADELIPFEEEAERSGGELPADVTAAQAKRARELGLHSTNMPKDLGCGGCTSLQQVLVQEQVGRVTNALAFTRVRNAAISASLAGILVASGAISSASSSRRTSLTRADVSEITLPGCTPGSRSSASVTRFTLPRISGV